jgi:hypothetical protein
VGELILMINLNRDFIVDVLYVFCKTVWYILKCAFMFVTSHSLLNIGDFLKFKLHRSTWWIIWPLIYYYRLPCIVCKKGRTVLRWRTLHLDDYMNTPRVTVVSPLHSEIVTVWCALSSIEIFGPLFIDSIVTLNSYLSLLSDEFASYPMGYGIPTNSAWFQQNDFRPHQQCRTLISSWHFREETPVESVSCAIWKRHFMANNITWLQPLRLFCVRVLEG